MTDISIGGDAQNLRIIASTWVSMLCCGWNLARPCPSQDSVRGGKPGNRKMCVAAARRGLAAGSSIIIDRTNFDADQRADFIQLGRSMGAQVLHPHAAFCSGRRCPRQRTIRCRNFRWHRSERTPATCCA